MTATNPNRPHLSEAAVLAFLSAIIWAIILLGCTSCSTTKCIPERVEVHDTLTRTDTQYVYRFEERIVYRDHKDSTHIYEKDSTSERQRGDTIYITRWKVKYQYVYKATTDSAAAKSLAVDKSKTEQKHTQTQQEVIVKTERYIPGFYKFTMWAFWIAVVLLLIKVAAWVMEKIPATAPYIALIRKFIPFL